MGWGSQLAGLRAALMMGRMLGRTVVLPLFCLYTSSPGVYKVSRGRRCVQRRATLLTGLDASAVAARDCLSRRVLPAVMSP